MQEIGRREPLYFQQRAIDEKDTEYAGENYSEHYYKVCINFCLVKLVIITCLVSPYLRLYAVLQIAEIDLYCNCFSIFNYGMYFLFLPWPSPLFIFNNILYLFTISFYSLLYFHIISIFLFLFLFFWLSVSDRSSIFSLSLILLLSSLLS